MSPDKASRGPASKIAPDRSDVEGETALISRDRIPADQGDTADHADGHGGARGDDRAGNGHGNETVLISRDRLPPEEAREDRPGPAQVTSDPPDAADGEDRTAAVGDASSAGPRGDKRRPLPPTPDDATMLLRLRVRVPRKIRPAEGVRGRLWRDFDADPKWIDGDPTGAIPLESPAPESVRLPDPPPGAKPSMLPRGLVRRGSGPHELWVPYQGRRNASTFVPMFGPADRLLRFFFIACWVLALALFWRWWFDPDHLITPVGFILNSALLLYLSYLPIYFVLTALRLRQVNPALPIRDYRVAFVVTKAPSEPWEVVLRTLRGMLDQDYPHGFDVWICDENPDDETYAWCRAHGVGISTRFGYPDYHKTTWPRRTKCKEGNLSFFYDHWGYDCYDVVAQLDADHVPEPGYLSEMVRPFADPKIGYVAAPSVCDANAADSWAARGRLYREANLHGPVQVGSNGWLAPVCFGSHYAVRTVAVRDTGGIGPELAEDFSTTFLLCAAGWDGAFAIDAEAHGDGPATFSAALTQEFQWSRSLMLLFIDMFPKYARRLPLLLRIRFLFSLSYYPMLAATTALGLLLAPIACFTGLPWVRVSYLHFLLLWGLGSVVMLVMNAYLRRRGLFRPKRSKLIGWEMWLFTLTRWPYVGWGVMAGMLQKIRPRPVTFKVTPKGDRGIEKLPIRLLIPYLAVTVISYAGALVGAATHHPLGYLLLSLLGGTAYLAATLGVSIMHGKETGRGSGVGLAAALSTIRAPLVAVVVLAVVGAAAVGLTWQTYGDLLASTVRDWYEPLRGTR